MKNQCTVCGKEKEERHFHDGGDVCSRCVERQHQAALVYSARVSRDKEAVQLAKKELDDATKIHQTSERDKAPPREYPWPFRASKT